MCSPVIDVNRKINYFGYKNSYMTQDVIDMSYLCWVSGVERVLPEKKNQERARGRDDFYWNGIFLLCLC